MGLAGFLEGGGLYHACTKLDSPQGQEAKQFMLTCRVSHPSGKISFVSLQNKVMPRIEGGRRKGTLRADGCSPISLKCSSGDLFKLARWQGVAAWGSLGQ